VFAFFLHAVAIWSCNPFYLIRVHVSYWRFAIPCILQKFAITLIVIKMKNQIYRCDALGMNSYHRQMIRHYSYAVDRDM